MKNINKLALLLAVGALLPFAASAETPETYIDSCQKTSDVPVPVSVVAPRTDRWDIGQEVRVEFVVDTAGHAENINVTSGNDSDLADAVVDAVRQWTFTPAQRNGMPVAARVILPVRVVKPEKSYS